MGARQIVDAIIASLAQLYFNFLVRGVDKGLIFLRIHGIRGRANTNMLQLRYATPTDWGTRIAENIDVFLPDHASCEKKASATALSLASHYPDRFELVDSMVELACEELEHFRQVHRLMAARKLQMRHDDKDPYILKLRKLHRTGPEPYFLDRLLLAAIIEARGCERFGLVAAALPSGELKDFYEEITRSEARHHGQFQRLARTYFPADEVSLRLDQLLIQEAAIVKELPFRVALH